MIQTTLGKCTYQKMSQLPEMSENMIGKRAKAGQERNYENGSAANKKRPHEEWGTSPTEAREKIPSRPRKPARGD